MIHFGGFLVTFMAAALGSSMMLTLNVFSMICSWRDDFVCRRYGILR